MSTHFVNLIDGLQRRSLRMASAVEDMLEEACDAALKTDHSLAQRVIARDKEIDAEEVEVESEVIHLITLFQPMASDMRLLCTILKVNSDLERVADCAVNIAERARHLDPQRETDPSLDLKPIMSIVRQYLRNAVQAYSAGDADAAQRIRGEDDVIDAFYGQFIRRLTVEAAQSPERMATCLDTLSIAKNLERIADHATNIAEDVIFLGTGQIVRHSGA
ncbi:MAG TPA: phosphate signaling complex protein PhoU [Phycisphaerae bacterium]|nr:phosphate signaling complex protein PhoU [Phycisphaerae bacterium]